MNHGFGIYNTSLELLAQTQAMPGYINRLQYTFATPGTYHILRLEYCGLMHQLKRGERSTLTIPDSGAPVRSVRSR